MALTSDWSVTLTGALLPGGDATDAWAQVARLLQMDVASLQARVPMTLAAVDEAEARQQVEGLEACGMVAQLLPDAGKPRIWLHRNGPTRGPVSEEYVRAAHDDAALGDDVQVCVQGQDHWQSLRHFPGASPVAASYAIEDVANQPPPAPSTSMPPPAPAPARSARPCGKDGKLLTHRQMPGLHAGFWARLAARVIDWFIATIGAYLLMVIVVAMVMIMVPGMTSGDESTAETIGQLSIVTGAVVAWLYYALFESSAWQATPGKLALGLRVTDLAGERVSFGRASGRFVARIVSAMTFYIGYMMAGWTARKQALHGMIAGCCVVHARALSPAAGPLQRASVAPVEPVASTPAASTWNAGQSKAAPAPRRGLPAWAIALIVAGCALVPISILAAIAVPAYQLYTVRTQIVAGMPLADDAKAAVSEYALRTGKMPPNNRTLGLGKPQATHGRYVSGVDVRHGKVVLTYAGPDAESRIHGGHLFLTPHRVDYGLHWSCRSPDIKDRYLPRQCRQKR